MDEGMKEGGGKKVEMTDDSKLAIFKKNANAWHTHLIHPPPEFVCNNHRPSAQIPEIY